MKPLLPILLLVFPVGVGATVVPGYLLSARFDRHFIATTAAIAILSGIAVAQRPGLFVPILILDLWLLGYHHVISTYTRLCFDAKSFGQRRWMIFGLLPAVFAAVTIIAATTGIWPLATIYLYWQWFHYTRQSYGIAQAYRHAGPAVDGCLARTARLDHLAFYLVPLWGILHRAHEGPDRFLGQAVWHPPVPGAMVDMMALLAIAGLVWWGASRFILWQRGALAVGHTLYVASHFAVFYTGYVAIDSIDAGWIALNIWHNAQYIAFVWLQNNRRFADKPDAGARFLSWLSQRRNVCAYLVVCLGLSTALYTGLQWSAAAAGFGMATMMVAYQTINFHHYIVDALIWRRPRHARN
jgi:transposase